MGARKSDIVHYGPEKVQQMLRAISEGRTVAELVLDPQFPSRATFYYWLRKDPALQLEFEAAREQSAMSLEEDALDMARRLEGKNDFTALKTKQFEIAMAQYRWSATRRDPKRFAERREMQVIVPVQINTTLDLGQGTTGTTEHPNIYHIEARVPLEPLGDGDGVGVEVSVPDPDEPKPAKETKPLRPKLRRKTLRGYNATIANQRHKRERQRAAKA